MSLTLRSYQEKLLDDITEAALKHRRILAVLPTGAGKAVIAAAIISHANANGQSVLFLCHRIELVNQIADKLKQYGVDHAFMANGKFYDPTFNVLVASIQTAHSWVVRRKKEAAPKAGLIIIDEAHHLSSSKTWSDITALYPDAYVVGFTATPMSRAGKGLAAHFDTLICGPTISELTAQGYLVPVKYVVPSIPDLQTVKVRNGDYAENQLEAAMDKQQLVGDICENWSIWSKDRKTLVFAVSIKHSIHIAEEFKKLGIAAAHIDGNTPAEEREKLIARFKLTQKIDLANDSHNGLGAPRMPQDQRKA